VTSTGREARSAERVVERSNPKHGAKRVQRGRPSDERGARRGAEQSETRSETGTARERKEPGAAQAATRSNPKRCGALGVERGAIPGRCGDQSVEHGAIRDQCRAQSVERGAIRERGGRKVSSTAQAVTRSNPKGYGAVSVERGASRGAEQSESRSETGAARGAKCRARSESWSGAIRITEQSADGAKRKCRTQSNLSPAQGGKC
jgi:hypothetical protein